MKKLTEIENQNYFYELGLLNTIAGNSKEKAHTHKRYMQTKTNEL